MVAGIICSLTSLWYNDRFLFLKLGHSIIFCGLIAFIVETTQIKLKKQYYGLLLAALFNWDYLLYLHVNNYRYLISFCISLIVGFSIGLYCQASKSAVKPGNDITIKIFVPLIIYVSSALLIFLVFVVNNKSEPMLLLLCLISPVYLPIFFKKYSLLAISLILLAVMISGMLKKSLYGLSIIAACLLSLYPILFGISCANFRLHGF